MSPATALAGFARVPVADLHPSPNNPRETLRDIDELALSIREVGLVQPIIAQKIPGKPGFQIIAGHRRHAAVIRLGWDDVPTIVRRDMLPDAELLAMLVENGQRAGLDPIEEARALNRLKTGGMPVMTGHTAGPCENCGYVSGPSKTQGLAEWGLARHSCDRQRLYAARQRRVAARKAADGPRRECACPVARHAHGTHAAYVVDRCRCRRCRDAAATYERNRTRQRAYGRQAYVPAGRARAHVLHLGRQGMGWKRVAAAAGVATTVVWKLVYGDRARGLAPSKRIRPTTEAKILAVTLDLADGALVDGTGTRRRLQALVAVGWSQTRLGERLGMQAGNFGVLIHGRRGGRVTVATARRVAELYDDLWDQRPAADSPNQAGGITKAQALARRYGWPPPLAWDDDTIDDPEVTPEVTTLPVAGATRRTRTDIADDVQWYLDDVDRAATADQVAHRLSFASVTAVQKALSRAGRRDLLDRLADNAELIHGARVSRRRAS